MSASSPVVLIVEDEESYIEALEVGLKREGFITKVARDGPEALLLFQVVQPDLVLLDLMLPGMSGVDVCRQIRLKSRTPVIMVTAKDTELDTVVGLEVGADDYVTKPYGLRELVARMRAVLRRAPAGVGSIEGETVEIGDVRVDGARREVTVRGELVALPRKEYELLDLLMQHAGRVLTREQLIDEVWGPDYVGDTKTLDVHVKRIRGKIESDPGKPTRLTTIRGVGYRYETRAEGRE
ncbi:MAG: two-component system, OmpR family, response regulator RegX3 [Acidimicrobiaceae bacterium]|jgi:two-component system response regulator RegX3|nr:two-component system, OmpR family, response regulator RegX3 [Acidimicrobiaceae bacterium]